MRKRLPVLIALLILSHLPSEALAGGLSTNLGEVLITGLGLGERYSLKELANIPLSVVNRGEDSVLVKVHVLVPDSVELRREAEPIPSVDWISLEKDSLILAPGQMATADVFIEIPNDTTFAARKFQVILWSRTVPGPGVFIACGLKSRIIFSTAELGPADDVQKKDAIEDSQKETKRRKDRDG
ncbi:MAG: hypothetical protein V2A71_05250 [Candidatus Eisenbacteria bacterium]